MKPGTISQVGLDWDWFMSVDCNGHWLVTRGRASMDVGERDISGTMCIGGADNEEPEIYAHFSSPLDDEGALAVTFVSPREDVPEFVLHGSAFELQAGTNFARTLILTDGTTVVGFAKHQPV